MSQRPSIQNAQLVNFLKVLLTTFLMIISSASWSQQQDNSTIDSVRQLLERLGNQCTGTPNRWTSCWGVSTVTLHTTSDGEYIQMVPQSTNRFLSHPEFIGWFEGGEPIGPGLVITFKPRPYGGEKLIEERVWRIWSPAWHASGWRSWAIKSLPNNSHAPEGITSLLEFLTQQLVKKESPSKSETPFRQTERKRGHVACAGPISGWDKGCIGESGFTSSAWGLLKGEVKTPFDFKRINPMYQGERYVGAFVDGKPGGWGVEYSADGRVARQGIWRYGELKTATGKTDEITTLLAFHASVHDEPVAVAETVTAPSVTSSASSDKDEIERLRAQLAALQTGAANPPKQDTPVLADRRRVALVIGNSKYEVGALVNPANDARDMAAALKRQGFKVIKHDNLTLRQTQNAMREFADEFKKSDVGLVYYSGHGVEAKGVNYLIPVNANIRREYELTGGAYPASQITGMMEEIQASGDRKRVAILILDACRDNPLTRSWRSSGGGLARMDAPAGTFISFATSPGSVASDGVGRNSPFTKHLLQAMKKPNVPIELMFKEVRVGVVNETRGEQVPWESSSLMGDFYFNRTTSPVPSGAEKNPTDITVKPAIAQKPTTKILTKGQCVFGKSLPITLSDEKCRAAGGRVVQ